MQTFLGLELDLDPLKFSEIFRRDAVKSGKDFASERGNSLQRACMGSELFQLSFFSSVNVSVDTGH